MASAMTRGCEFDTARLRVGPWHASADHFDLDLAAIVAGMLTESTASTLPAAWRGAFGVERARNWIDERDHESPTLLAVDRVSGEPVALVILFETPLDDATVDVRIGYIVAEPARGRGVATELVAGLVDWARAHRSISTLTAGVAATNPASTRVLVENGFERAATEAEDVTIHRLVVEHHNEWDAAAAGWDDDVATRSYAASAFASLQAALQNDSIMLDGARVIDFGCGTGLLTERLIRSGAIVRAVDTSTTMLAVLQAKIDRHGWSEVAATTDLPTPPALHDLVVCSSVCSFLDDYPATVRQLVRVLRPGGLFVQWDWERNENDAEPHGLTRTEIRDALTAAGLRDVSVDTAFVATANGQTMRPLMGRGRSPDPAH